MSDRPKTYRVPSVRVLLVRDGSTSVPREVNCSSAAMAVARQLIGDAEREHFVVMGIDGRNRVVASSVVVIGQRSSCTLVPADVLRAVLLMSVDRFIVAHNHPSGDPTPSPEDVTMTRKLAHAATLVGLTLLDHVVLGEGSAVAFSELGLL